MKLQTSKLPQIRQLLQTNGWFTLCVAFTLVALELLGRQTGSDFYDALSVGLLITLGVAIGIRHRHQPLPWLSRLRDLGLRVTRWLDSVFKLELGLDLRGLPPLPRRMPRGTLLVFTGLISWLATAALAWYFLPQGWRTLGIHGFYLGYITALALLWLFLSIVILVGIYSPLNMLHQWLGGDASGTARRRIEFVVGATYLTLVFTAAWTLSPMPALICCGLALLGCAVFSLRSARLGDEQFIWRTGPNSPVYAVSSHRLLMTACAMLILFMTALMMSATGGRLVGHPQAEAAMPVTVLLGSVLAWLIPGTLFAGVMKLWQLWWRNPARRSRPVLHVLGDHFVDDDRHRIREAVRAQGWNVRWGEPDSPSAAVQIVPPLHSEANEFDPSWPLKVSIEDLEQGDVFERFARRREIQLRRHLSRGFQRLFKAAAQNKRRPGNGYWLAPHLWFLAGMTRDEQDRDEREDTPLMMRTIGPLYANLFHRYARQYLHQLMRSMEVDLLFVEDGIDYRKLSRVFKVIYELYDRHAGERRAEETHFQGLPKVRVMIHDFRIDQPFRSEVYPEPKFDDLGRARILHIFRDRGEHEERIDPPGDRTSSPAPVLVG